MMGAIRNGPDSWPAYRDTVEQDVFFTMGKRIAQGGGLDLSPLLLPVGLAYYGALSSLFLIPILIVAASLALVLIGFSVGPEVFESIAGAYVVCEPLPRCSQQNVTLVMLWPTLEDRLKMPMRHSMYDLPLVQKWVADWILTSAGRSN